jgi:hypothetical protein
MAAFHPAERRGRYDRIFLGAPITRLAFLPEANRVIGVPRKRHGPARA